MDWSTHVVSATTSDTNPSVVVTFDSGKYIFNVGENTTRTLLHAGSVGTGGWKRMRAVFLTQLTPERVSGLPGEPASQGYLASWAHFTDFRIYYDTG